MRRCRHSHAPLEKGASCCVVIPWSSSSPAKIAGTLDWTIPPGFATERHVHRVQDETFYVLDGECEWHVGERMVRATPGTYLFIPPEVPHNITNVSEKPARVLMTVSRWSRALFRKARQTAAQGAPDPKALADLRNRYDRPALDVTTRS